MEYGVQGTECGTWGMAYGQRRTKNEVPANMYGARGSEYRPDPSSGRGRDIVIYMVYGGQGAQCVVQGAGYETLETRDDGPPYGVRGAGCGTHVTGYGVRGAGYVVRDTRYRVRCARNGARGPGRGEERSTVDVVWNTDYSLSATGC